MTPEQVRVFGAVIEDARTFHRQTLEWTAEGVGGHAAVYFEDEGWTAPDKECLTCGHINEAETALAEAEAVLR